MAEKLSQEQIDALMAMAVSGADEDTASGSGDGSQTDAAAQRANRLDAFNDKKLKQYDFKNPKIFSSEHMRIFKLIHDNYIRHLSSYLQGILRTDVTISIHDIEEQKYYEYSNSLPDSVVMGVLEASPIEGNMLIEIQKNMVYTIIDRLLGGAADDITIQENLSEIEIKLMEKVYRQIIVFLKDAWQSACDLEPVFQRIEFNSRLTQLIPIDEVVVIVLLKVKIKEQEGSMSICIPCMNLEHIITNKSSYMIYNRRRKDSVYQENKEIILKNIGSSYLNVYGILGNTTLSFSDLMNLQVGDVIPLNKSTKSPVTLKIGNKEWFSGEIGTRKNRMAVKVKEVL